MLFDDKKTAIKSHRENRTKQAYASDKEVLSNKWKSLLGDPVAAKNAITYGCLDGDDSKALRVYNFIIRKFTSCGFSEEDAIEYMVNNSKIFSVDVDRIASVLSISDFVGKGDEIFFDHVDTIYGPLDVENLYIAAKSFGDVKCSARNLLDKAYSLPIKKSDDERVLSEKKKVFFTTLYLKKMLREKEVQKELK